MRVIALTTLCVLACAAPAQAVPDCPDAQPAKTVLSGQGLLESIIAGPDGALYYTDTTQKALMRLTAPDAQPTPLATDIDAPGGLLVGLDGKSIVQGYGDGFQQGALGNLVGLAGLLRIDLATGEKTTIATGLTMANGLARDAAGVVYASNDVSTGIDRVEGDKVDVRWADVISSNGLAVDSTSRYLFANQTFQPAAIQQIDLGDPAKVTQYAAPGPEDVAAGLDGLTIGVDDTLYAAANGIGEAWRIGTDKSICALARGLGMPSAVAFGAGGAFPVTSLYVVTFGGTLVEIPQARAAPPTPAAAPLRLRVRVRPRRLRAKRFTRVRVRVRRGDVPEPGALIRIRRKRAVTDGSGRAIVRVRPRRPGRLSVRISAPGLKTVRRILRVRRAARGPRPRALID